jgi:hypothetical protein
MAVLIFMKRRFLALAGQWVATEPRISPFFVVAQKVKPTGSKFT